MRPCSSTSPTSSWTATLRGGTEIGPSPPRLSDLPAQDVEPAPPAKRQRKEDDDWNKDEAIPDQNGSSEDDSSDESADEVLEPKAAQVHPPDDLDQEEYLNSLTWFVQKGRKIAHFYELVDKSGKYIPLCHREGSTFPCMHADHGQGMYELMASDYKPHAGCVRYLREGVKELISSIE